VGIDKLSNPKGKSSLDLAKIINGIFNPRPVNAVFWQTARQGYEEKHPKAQPAWFQD